MSVQRFFFNARVLSSSWRSLVSLVMFLALCLHAAHAQSQEGKETQKGRDEAITLKAHLVSTDVMVRDKKGKYITDLKAEDFAVFENGLQQKVEFFDPPVAVRNEASRLNAPAQEGSLTYGARPMNIISLVLDGQTTELANTKQVRDGTLKYIRQRITDNDTVAVFAVTNGLQLLQPFTQDKAKLISAVERAYASTVSSKTSERNEIAGQIAELQESLKNSGPASQHDLQTNPGARVAQVQAMVALRALQRFTVLRAQLSLQQSRPVLAALAAICDAQRAIPGKKTVVLFSQGFITSSTQDWQVQGTIDIANRANVAVYIIDSAGLTASAPQSGSFAPASPLAGISSAVDSEARIRAVGGENVFDNARHEGLNRQHDILYRISDDTGGKFIKGTNDIGNGLDRIDQEIRSRYTLAYYSTDPNFDGSFRKWRVEVRRPEAQVASRSGYYAIMNEDIVPLSPEDKKLLANFTPAEANPAFPLFLELSSFRSQEGRYIVPVSVEVPPGAVKFGRKGDKQHLHLNVLGVVRETEDKILSRLGGRFDVGLTSEQYQSILNNKIFYRQDMELPPGNYSVELIIRDELSGKVAAKRERLVLPVPAGEFSITGVVLSHHAEAAKGTVGSRDVLSHEGALIRPSPSREFRATDNLIIFFELYNAATSAETGKPLVSINARLMKDGKAASRPLDYVLTETVNEPIPHMTFARYIKLSGLPAGEYTAMIEARDVITRRLVKRQASFVITQ